MHISQEIFTILTKSRGDGTILTVMNNYSQKAALTNSYPLQLV